MGLRHKIDLVPAFDLSIESQHQVRSTCTTMGDQEFLLALALEHGIKGSVILTAHKTHAYRVPLKK